MRTRILVIDDEESWCDILHFNLEKEGYEVDCANSAEEALEMDLTVYSLFIVDIMMDRMSGFDFAKRVKNNPALELTPIIFCSALNGEDETVMGLNIGGDDYITKPFVNAEVIARVRAVLRRASLSMGGHHVPAVHPADIPAVPPVIPAIPTPADRNTAVNTPVAPAQEEPDDASSDIVFKGLRINDTEKTCYIDGEQVELTKTEFAILQFFLTHRNRVYSRDEILHHVWGDDLVVTTRAVDTNITRLRPKIGEYRKHLVTRLGFGYVFKEEAN